MVGGGGAERLAFLLRVGDLFASSLDYERTLANVARAAVPFLADYCAFDELGADGRLRRVAWAHADPEGERLLGETVRYAPALDLATHPLALAVRDGSPAVFEDIPDAALRAVALDDAHFEILLRLAPQTLLCAPVRLDGEVIGALTFVRERASALRALPLDAEVAMGVADRAALAIGNARLHRALLEREADLRLAHERETQLRERAERSVRFAELFGAMLGHDLRSPLGAILHGARLLERVAADERQAAAAARVTRSAERMARMIDQLLDFTRIRVGGGIPMAPRPVDLGALTRAVVDELEVAHPGRAVAFEQAGDARGVWDPDRLMQVAANLVGNALQHGGDPLVVRVDGAREDEVSFSVRNAGVVPPEVTAAMFEPFRGPRPAGSRGLGLGLYISHWIVTAHGGTVAVDSRPEAGTTITVRLPRRPP